MPENELQPPYTLYFAPRCSKCQTFLQHLQGLTIGRHMIYYNVQQQRPPRNIQFVPTLVNNKNNKAHVGHQAFELLQLWLQEKSMTCAPSIGSKGLGFASYEDGEAMDSSLFGADYD